ncbi:MAG: response regulator [Erysipelotrichales bacterium]|nr:response regulator [Erysipelotrichales bacterium]
MQIKEIFEHIPSTIASLFSSIYCVSKDDDKAYYIEYTGNELKILSENKYDYFKNELSKYNNLIEEIENNSSVKKVVNNELIVYTETKDKYKIVLLSKLVEDVTDNTDKQTILIADDSPIITKFFTKTFENDFNVLVAANGEEAIKLINDNLNSNLVGAFIDLMMPVKSGYDVLEYLKENNLFEQLPVSVISGEDSQDGIQKATSYGIIDMLQKPFDANAARAIVNKTIQHKK